MNRTNTIGFVSCGALGSSLMHTAAFRELRRAFPSSNIGVASDRRGVELFRHNPYGIKVFDVMGTGGQIDRDFFETLNHIKEEAYGAALVFRLGEPYYMKVSQYVGGFQERIGHYGGNTIVLNNFYSRLLNTPGYEDVFLDKFGFTSFAAADSETYFGAYNLTFLKPLGVRTEGLSSLPEIWSNASEAERIGNHFQGLGINDADIVVGVNIGGRQGNNYWEVDRYSEVINGLFQETEGRIFGRPLKVVVNYDVCGKYLFKDAMKTLPQGLPVYGVPDNMSMGQLAEAVGRCDFFVSTDTGSAHVAQARKIPSLVLYPDEPTRKRWMCPEAQVLPLVGLGHVNDISAENVLYSSLNAILQWGRG